MSASQVFGGLLSSLVAAEVFVFEDRMEAPVAFSNVESPDASVPGVEIFHGLRL